MDLAFVSNYNHLYRSIYVANIFLLAATTHRVIQNNILEIYIRNAQSNI